MSSLQFPNFNSSQFSQSHLLVPSSATSWARNVSQSKPEIETLVPLNNLISGSSSWYTTAMAPVITIFNILIETSPCDFARTRKRYCVCSVNAEPPGSGSATTRCILSSPAHSG